MIVNVLDGKGQLKAIVWSGQQDTITDRSGSIVADNTSQQVMAANAARSGFIIQNTSLTGNGMTVNELGSDATVANSFVIPPGGQFPPIGYPVSVGAINIAGKAGDTFVAREW